MSFVHHNLSDKCLHGICIIVLQESMTSAQRAINAYNLLSPSRTSSAVGLAGEK